MALPDIFTKNVSDGIVQRINNLNSTTQPKWGKMSVGQMMAHCCVTYEMIYDGNHPAPKGLMKLMLKFHVKKHVVNETPYKHNIRTGPAFITTTEKDFNKEKARLVEYIQKTQQLGAAHFDGKESASFGPLNKTEWNNMFYKYLDHHLKQFGV